MTYFGGQQIRILHQSLRFITYVLNCWITSVSDRAGVSLLVTSRPVIAMVFTTTTYSNESRMDQGQPRVPTSVNSSVDMMSRHHRGAVHAWSTLYVVRAPTYQRSVISTINKQRRRRTVITVDKKTSVVSRLAALPRPVTDDCERRAIAAAAVPTADGLRRFPGAAAAPEPP